MNPRPAPRSRAVNGTVAGSQFVLLVATLTSLTLSVLITVLVARALTPAGFGFFALVAAVFILGRELLDLGTGNVAVREAARSPAREVTVLETLLLWRLGLAALLTVPCLLLATDQEGAGQGWTLGLAAGALLLSGLSALNPVFHLRQAQGAPALLAIGSQLALLLGCVVLTQAESPASHYALLLVAREALLNLGNALLAARWLGYWPRPRLHGTDSRLLLGAALSFGLSALCYQLYFHGSGFLVWFAAGEAALGAYAAAFRPMSPLLTLPWLLVLPLLPLLTDLAQRDRGAFERQAAALLRLALGFGAVLAAAGLLLAEPALALLYGPKYSVGDLSAVAACRWLAVALGLAWPIAALAALLLAAGQERLLLRVSVLGLLAAAIAHGLLLPQLGFTGAAAAVALTQALVWLAGLRLLPQPALVIHPASLLVLAPAALLTGLLLALPTTGLTSLLLGGAASILALLTVWHLPEQRRCRLEQVFLLRRAS